jgi:cytochrome b561
MTDRYTHTAVTLHWLIVLLIFAAFPLGLYMHDLPLSPNKLRLYSYHKWIGMLVLPLAVIRIYWRAIHRPPAMPGSMAKWEKLAAHTMHFSLYLLIFAVPITGWLMSSAKGFPVVLFGVLPLPDLVGKNKELGDALLEVHKVLNFIMLGLVLAHIAASLKHHFVERDDILVRMVPFLRKRS